MSGSIDQLMSAAAPGSWQRIPAVQTLFHAMLLMLFLPTLPGLQRMFDSIPCS